MQLDWSTLLLEVINFLVLVWILKRFLYKPVLNVIAQRKAAIDKTLSDAESLQSQAKDLEHKNQTRLADWEREKDGLRVELTAELQAQRERLTTELRSELAKEREKQAVLDRRRLAELETQAMHKGMDQALQFATRLLERTADAGLETQLVKIALDDLPHLSDTQKDVLRSTARDSLRAAKVTSAFPLPAAEREAICEALKGAIRQDVACTFHEDASLLAGIRITLGSWILRANLRDELAFSPRGRAMDSEAVDSASPLSEWLARYRFGLRLTEQGIVRSVGDGIARIDGLPSAAMEELLRFEDGSFGLVYSLEEDSISAILLEQNDTLASGSVAFLTRQRLGIPVGNALLGRIVDPLGAPLDGSAAPECSGWRELEFSPPIVAREFVNEPLYSGTKIVDTLIPMGKGQRQLVIGDNGLGKSAFAIDTVINQKGKDVLCVYVLVGQKRSTVVSTIETLRIAGALEYTTLVVAEATAPPGLKYLAPFAGCAVCEGWMAEGKNTLIVYDDLTAHAEAYRELSLLLRRPPGREAYPGDIFYLHSRLLERSTRLGHAYGGGSMTALPIVETKEGEIASYIPTNLISITDGQIYFDAALFAAGFLPAIDVTKSVSRIGGKAQHIRVAEEAGHMKLDYLRFLELEVFTRFGSRLEASVEAQIKRGRVLRELLKQRRMSPLTIEQQMAWMVGFNGGLFDSVSPADVPALMERLLVGAGGGMRLEASHEEWKHAVEGWISARGAA